MAKTVQPSKLSGNEFFEIVGNQELEAEFMSQTEDTSEGDSDETTDDKDTSEDQSTDTDTDDKDDDKTDDTDEDETEDEDDDYITAPEEDKPVIEKPPADAVATTEDQFVLAGLSKIPVNIIVAGADGKDVIQSVQVYGNGDLPANFKGFATPLEGENYRAAIAVQINNALRLREQYKENATRIENQKTQEAYTLKENRAIAEDLTELRKEELFPKFKGKPGTKEFNNSDGGKEFDKVIAFMNKRNDEYVTRANAGKSYRHIGFREAFEMMHGQNPKAAEQAEDKARKVIAGKTKSGRGADAGAKTTKTTRVSNLNDLAAEFLAEYPEA